MDLCVEPEINNKKKKKKTIHRRKKVKKQKKNPECSIFGVHLKAIKPKEKKNTHRTDTPTTIITEKNHIELINERQKQ